MSASHSQIDRSLVLGLLSRVFPECIATNAPSVQLEWAHGGFSRAAVIHAKLAGRDCALRGWLRESVPLSRVRERHRLLQHFADAGLPVAACYADGSTGETLLIPLDSPFDDWVWQVEPWLPGTPRSGASITEAQLDSVAQALAKLHNAAREYRCSVSGREWFSTGRGPVPAILERRQMLSRWDSARLAQARHSLQQAPADFRECCLTILSSAMPLVGAIQAELTAMSALEAELFPCWRDLWREHLLFEGEHLSGIIDATAARSDHPGTDLSRLLGSYFGDDFARWETFLASYQSIHPLTAIDLSLIGTLDRSSVLLSALAWIDRWEQGLVQLERISKIIQRLDEYLIRFSTLQKRRCFEPIFFP